MVQKVLRIWNSWFYFLIPNAMGKITVPRNVSNLHPSRWWLEGGPLRSLVSNVRTLHKVGLQSHQLKAGWNNSTDWGENYLSYQVLRPIDRGPLTPFTTIIGAHLVYPPTVPDVFCWFSRLLMAVSLTSLDIRDIPRRWGVRNKGGGTTNAGSQTESFRDSWQQLGCV